MNADARPMTVPDLLAMKAAGRRIVMLTCYDAAFARLLEQAEVDVLLVGDSVNQVLAGQETTLSATLDQMIYHAASVRRGARRALVFVDLPFLTYQVSTDRSDPERRPRAAGERRAWREARGRPADGGDGPGARGPRDSGDRSSRAHAPVRARARRLPGAGERCRDRRAAAGRRRGARGGRGLRRSSSSCCRRRSPSGSPPRSRSPRSASAPGAGCDGQVLVLHDMLGLNESSIPSSSSATPSWARRCAPRSGPTPPRCGMAPTPGQSTASTDSPVLRAP